MLTRDDKVKRSGRASTNGDGFDGGAKALQLEKSRQALRVLIVAEVSIRRHPSPLLDVFAARVAHAFTFGIVFEKHLDVLGRLVVVVLRVEQPDVSGLGQNVKQTTGGDGDDGNTGSHRLHNDETECFARARHDEHVQGRVRRG